MIVITVVVVVVIICAREYYKMTLRSRSKANDRVGWVTPTGRTNDFISMTLALFASHRREIRVRSVVVLRIPCKYCDFANNRTSQRSSNGSCLYMSIR